VAVATLIVICLVCSVFSSAVQKFGLVPGPTASASVPPGQGAATASNASAAVTPVLTATAAATDTPQATDTPEATLTPAATATTEQPIILKGSGDSVVDANKWTGPALVHAEYHGGDNFVVENYDDSGQQIDLLVNTIGSYDGYVPLDFLDTEHTTRFQIQASGPWTLTIEPFTDIPVQTVPGTIQGKGDQVYILRGGTPDLLKADASHARDNFIVVAYSQIAGRDLVINDIAPYSGTVIIPSDTFILVINATGSWSIEVTAK
jgi:hypothetical protein